MSNDEIVAEYPEMTMDDTLGLSRLSRIDGGLTTARQFFMDDTFSA